MASHQFSDNLCSFCGKSFNSMRVGATPPQEFTLRKPSTPSSTPKVSKKRWNFPTSLLSKYPLPEIDE